MRYQPKRIQEPKRNIKLAVLFGSCALIILGRFGIHEFQSKRFNANTFIQEIDCSHLTVEEAVEKLQETIRKQEIIFSFANDMQYQTNGEQLELSIEADLEEITSTLQNFWEEQKNNPNQSPYQYSLENPVRVDEEMVRQYLETIPELRKANMVKPQNAYLDWAEDGLLTIVPEIYGNEIDFEEAVDITLKELASWKNEINFASMTNSTPEILATNTKLQEEQATINVALNTEIQYELYDGSVFTLTPERIREWVEKDETGHYFINFEENAKNFLEELNNAASKANSKIIFHPTELEARTLSVPNRLRAKVDVDQEIELIRENLAQGGRFSREPTYVRIFDTREMLSYIEIDLTRQRVLMYYMGECIVDTPCVTGSVITHNETPPGLFYLSYKTRNATLMNNSFVKYWMPFNGDIGLHDASWRNTFGGEIYKTNGSHGCVNLPEEAAQIIYEHIDTSMPIIVYASAEVTI